MTIGQQDKLNDWIKNQGMKNLNEFLTKVVLGNVGIKPKEVFSDEQLNSILYNMMKFDEAIQIEFNKP